MVQAIISTGLLASYMCCRIHQELLVRLAAKRSQDPVSHTVNTCSTCSVNSVTENLPGTCTHLANLEILFFTTPFLWLHVGIICSSYGKGQVCHHKVATSSHRLSNC